MRRFFTYLSVLGLLSLITFIHYFYEVKKTMDGATKRVVMSPSDGGIPAAKKLPDTTSLTETTLASTENNQVIAPKNPILISANSSVSSIAKKVSSGICSFEKRRERMLEVCKRIDQAPAYPHLWVDTKNKFALCIINKVASSTLKRLMTSLHGISPRTPHGIRALKDAGLVTFASQTKKSKKEILATYKKVLAVRHPVDRLKSSYYNKFVQAHLLKGYKAAKRKYRKNKQDHYKHMYFDEFMKFINSDRKFNSHYNTYLGECQPCVVKYDYILKLETLNHDLEIFGQNVLKKSLKELFHAQINPGEYSGSKQLGAKTKKIPETKLLTDDEWNKLMLGRYKTDMDMFGYKFDRNTSTAICSDDDGCC